MWASVALRLDLYAQGCKAGLSVTVPGCGFASAIHAQGARGASPLPSKGVTLRASSKDVALRAASGRTQSHTLVCASNVGSKSMPLRATYHRRTRRADARKLAASSPGLNSKRHALYKAIAHLGQGFDLLFPALDFTCSLRPYGKPCLKTLGSTRTRL